MTHEHLYALLNDVCYRVPVPAGETKMLAIEDMTSKVSTIKRADSRVHTMKIQINTGNFREATSNDLNCKRIVDWATETKASSITDLRDSYKVEIDYCITSSTKRLIEEGTAVQTVSPFVILVAQPIAEGNHLTYTKALTFDKLIKFTKAFPASYGALHSVNESYSLEINAIRIKGITDLGFGDPKPNYFYPKVIDRTGRKTSGITSTTEEAILLLDTKAMGIDFDPEIITFLPRELAVEIKIVFDEFCQFFDENEILNIISENGGGPSSTTPPSEEKPPYEAPCHPNIHPHPIPPCGGCQCPFPPVPPCPPDRPITPPDKPDDPDNPDDPGYEGPGCDDDLIWDLQRVDATTPDSEKIYTVVADDTEDFDSETMIKYSEAAEKIADIQIGEQVYWGYTFLL